MPTTNLLQALRHRITRNTVVLMVPQDSNPAARALFRLGSNFRLISLLDGKSDGVEKNLGLHTTGVFSQVLIREQHGKVNERMNLVVINTGLILLEDLYLSTLLRFQ